MSSALDAGHDTLRHRNSEFADRRGPRGMCPWRSGSRAALAFRNVTREHAGPACIRMVAIPAPSACGSKQSPDPIGNAPGGLAELFHRPVVGMAGDGRPVEQPSVQRGGQQQVAFRRGEITAADALEPAFRSASFGHRRLQLSSDTHSYDLRRNLFLRGDLFGERWNRGDFGAPGGVAGRDLEARLRGIGCGWIQGFRETSSSRNQ